MRSAHVPAGWSVDSWRDRPVHQAVEYSDADSVRRAAQRLRELPPLVTSGEIEHLREHVAQAQRGDRFLLHGGDCAESFAECTPDVITNKLKILLQMSLVLVHGLKQPVTRVGRFAGQYAKPRSNAIETREIGGKVVSLPSYFGDSINGYAFDPVSRKPDPERMIAAHLHAAMTLNFVRALVDGGFADIHHPENWNVSLFGSARLTDEQRSQYEAMTSKLADGLRFMQALGEKSASDVARVEFFTSHEGLNLEYESAHTRRVPRRDWHYNLSTHMPWIGNRTRDINAAHIEYFRGVRNPVGVKLGADTSPDEVRAIADALNPDDESGRLVLITRVGAGKVRLLAPVIESVKDKNVLWVCDPMHGNTQSVASGIKTRRFDDVITELMQTIELHESLGTRLGGISCELTGEDVTECVGGASGVTEDGLHQNYASPCDPRLNYQQALELSFTLARRLGR
ncbi:MAG: 3-deoxy-7-phosphoheptulonate synthase [Phycisphaeraceae bacterium]|nr:3-deoxy-7-phosphoheptulonate synthase [Phycisphaerales bacterium]MCB9859862.1 3-deoxy-7-phosphoheptulonate synthase [Phycisphaeraceae bacterium]